MYVKIKRCGETLLACDLQRIIQLNEAAHLTFFNNLID